MRKLFWIFVLLAVVVSGGWAQYPYYTITQLQKVAAESLAVADTLTGFSANSNQARWLLQTSPRVRATSGSGDTVVTTGIVVVPPGVITYTAGIYTMLLYDTAANNTSWGAILLRANPADSVQLKKDGFLNVNPGDIITLTGLVSEFPSQRSFSFTQLQPIAGKPITIVGSAPVPKPIVKNISDFYQGIYSTGKIRYSTGEPFEAFYVELRNVTMNGKVNTTRGTISVVDGSGNDISTYDWSHFFTLGHGAFGPDTNWAATYALLGSGRVIDTLRGVVSTSSGNEGPRGYRIAPIYPGDIKFSSVPAPPIVSTHRRNPVVLTPNDSAVVSIKVTKQTNGASPKTVSLTYSAAGAAFTTVTMNFQASDTTYVGIIPKQANNVFVKYFVQAADSFGQVARVANSSAASSIAADTGKGFFFYTSLNRPLTIQDVQNTPYVHGRSGYVGAVIPLSGIITADTSKIALTPGSNGWTNAWYMQSGNAPWSGIWLTTSDSTAQKLMAALRNGDSVTVTGTVQEQVNDLNGIGSVTRLGNISAVTKISGGNPEPAAVSRTTGSLTGSNGNSNAEPYEGMLVKLTNVTVTDINPTFSDPTEFNVNDGSGAAVVQRSGKNKYSNVPSDSSLGKTILRVGNKIGSLTGIVYYSFSQYKFVPRTDADFVGVILTGVDGREGARAPATYMLSQNYPNPFNPTTQIQYGLPAAGFTTLTVYNLLGQEVASLVNTYQTPGTYTVKFDASAISSGMYFFRVQSGSFTAVKKMMLLK